MRREIRKVTLSLGLFVNIELMTYYTRLHTTSCQPLDCYFSFFLDESRQSSSFIIEVYTICIHRKYF